MHAAIAGAGIVHIADWLVSEHIAAGRLVALLPDTSSPYPKGAELKEDSGATLKTRNLALDPPPHIGEAYTIGRFAPAIGRTPA